jgi:hypothetical protein
MSKQICLFAYSDSPTFGPKTTEFIELWESLRVFGRLRAKAVIYEWGKPPRGRNSEKSVFIGDTTPWSDLDARPLAVIGGGVDVYVQGETTAETYEQTILSFGVCKEGYWRGLRTPSHSSLIVADSIVDGIAAETINKLIDLHFSNASRRGAFYGLVDVGEAKTMLAGNGFSSANLIQLPLDQKLRHAHWIRRGFPNRQAMGVFWGNFFSTEMLARIGGEKSLISLVEDDFYAEAKNNASLWSRCGDGICVRLSSTPFFSDKNDQLAGMIEHNALLLQKMLVSCNLL